MIEIFKKYLNRFLYYFFLLNSFVFFYLWFQLVINGGWSARKVNMCIAIQTRALCETTFFFFGVSCLVRTYPCLLCLVVLGVVFTVFFASKQSRGRRQTTTGRSESRSRVTFMRLIFTFEVWKGVVDWKEVGPCMMKLVTSCTECGYPRRLRNSCRNNRVVFFSRSFQPFPVFLGV